MLFGFDVWCFDCVVFCILEVILRGGLLCCLVLSFVASLVLFVLGSVVLFGLRLRGYVCLIAIWLFGITAVLVVELPVLFVLIVLLASWCVWCTWLICFVYCFGFMVWVRFGCYWFGWM